MENTIIELPRYKCHKVVHALKIGDIHASSVNDDLIIVPSRKDYAHVHVNSEYAAKHEPHIGGYYVIYKGGYQSFSPADAFESGYTEITTQPLTPEIIDALIASEDYYIFDGTQLTVCCLVLKNGCTVTGESSCINPNNFDLVKGEVAARKAACNKIWELEGYRIKANL